MIERFVLPVGHRRSRLEGEGGTGALLFVRSLADLSCAVAAVNQFLSRRHTHGSVDSETLGILVGAGLDTSLLQRGQGVAHPASTEVTLRYSVALSGIWSLSWFDLGSIDERGGAGGRRRRLLDNLLPGVHADSSLATGPRYFLPVLSAAEARGQEVEGLDDLAGRYQAVTIGTNGFVADPACGKLLRLRQNITVPTS